MKQSALTALLILIATSAYAQVSFTNYQCADGTQAVAALYKGDNRLRLQVDGHSYALPKRLSVSGVRYAKSGVSLLIKGQEGTLRRPKKKATLCRTQ